MTAATLAYVGECSRRIGWEACELAYIQAGQATARAARPLWRHPRYNELEARRTPDYRPCPSKCGKCSRCICSIAYWRRGGRSFAGLAAEAARVTQ